MSTADRAKQLHTLLAKLRPKGGAVGAAALANGHAASGHGSPAAIVEVKPDPSSCVFHTDPVLCEFMVSFLAWEAPMNRAIAALQRVREACVDINEFRVCLPDEITSIIGSSYPKIDDRVARLRRTLSEIYKREHRMRLSHLLDMNKREARAYLDTLPGIPGFVAARVALVCLEAHAFPLDQRMLARLVAVGIIDEQADVDSASAWLERTIKAGDAREAFTLLHAWTDDHAVRSTRAVRASKKRAAPAKKTTASRPARPAKKTRAKSAS